MGTFIRDVVLPAGVPTQFLSPADLYGEEVEIWDPSGQTLDIWEGLPADAGTTAHLIIPRKTPVTLQRVSNFSALSALGTTLKLLFKTKLEGGAGGGGGSGAEGQDQADDHYSVSRHDFTVALKPLSTDTLVFTFPAGFWAVSLDHIQNVTFWDLTGLATMYIPEDNPFVWDPVLGELQVVGAAFAVTDLAYDVELIGPLRRPLGTLPSPFYVTGVEPSAGTAGGSYIYLSPQDFTATFLAGTQLTLAGIPYVPTIEQFIEVVVQTAAGTSLHYSSPANAFAYNPGTGVLTVTGATFNGADLGYRVVLVGPDKAYTQVTNSLRTTETDPLSSQHINENLLTSGALAIGTYYYPAATGLSMAGFRNLVVGLQVGATAIVTIEGSVDPTATDFFDIGRSGYDLMTNSSGVANWSGTNAILEFEELSIPLVRIKVVVAGGAAAMQIDVRRTAI